MRGGAWPEGQDRKGEEGGLGRDIGPHRRCNCVHKGLYTKVLSKPQTVLPGACSFAHSLF